MGKRKHSDVKRTWNKWKHSSLFSSHMMQSVCGCGCVGVCGCVWVWVCEREREREREKSSVEMWRRRKTGKLSRHKYQSHSIN